MVVKEVKSICFDLLKEKLTPLEFKPNKKQGRFTKLNEFGFDEIWFGTVEYAALKTYKLYFYISVRIDRIERLKNLFINYHDENAKLKNPTCNINCGTLIGNPSLEFEIHTHQDVINAVETFWKIYKDYGIDHIKKCYDINFLNSLFPTYHNNCKDWLTVHGWYMVVPTVAFLADKKTFPEFRKEYTSYLVNDLKMPENKLSEMNEYLDKIIKI
jgi:hypothetical protein